MRCKKKHFLEILAIEMDDLHEDVLFLMSCSAQKNTEGAVTEHVYFGNEVLLRNEMRGFELFKDMCRHINTEEFEGVDELIGALKKGFASAIHENGIAPFIMILIERKMKKVQNYVSQ
ncbi:MAG: hypothetical protein EOL87_00465 [Spartobacteria bacterium]|nr:hypothetical protein [Spartobacteria bacterium]